MSTTTALLAAATLRDPRWAALIGREKNPQPTFFYSVATTGVYCRPSCAARPPRPENVAFHDSVAAAERAGFRACKRCLPNQPPLATRQAAQVAQLCRFIENSDEVPSLAALASQVGMSAHHVHRLFKATTGLTPRAYADAQREKRVRTELGVGKTGTVTEAIYDAGYGSSARFYEKAQQVLGMTPSKYRQGGAELEIRFAVGECSLGSILVAATARGVCAIFLGADPNELTHELERRFPRAQLLGENPEFAAWVAQVVGLVETSRLASELPLDVRGTAFQQRVWQALREIPVGATASYGDVARAIDRPAACRAVARACAENPIAVAIPCHRVVRNDGSLSGYRWGVERKRILLEREARVGNS